MNGYGMIFIDTDPETNLAMTLHNAKIFHKEIVAIIPRQFTQYTFGFLVITYDKTEDVKPEYPEIEVTLPDEPKGA